VTAFAWKPDGQNRHLIHKGDKLMLTINLGLDNNKLYNGFFNLDKMGGGTKPPEQVLVDNLLSLVGNANDYEEIKLVGPMEILAYYKQDRVRGGLKRPEKTPSIGLTSPYGYRLILRTPSVEVEKQDVWLQITMVIFHTTMNRFDRVLYEDDSGNTVLLQAKRPSTDASGPGSLT
jgi:hypothetical protein